jgi:hypothetical protein
LPLFFVSSPHSFRYHRLFQVPSPFSYFVCSISGIDWSEIWIGFVQLLCSIPSDVLSQCFIFRFVGTHLHQLSRCSCSTSTTFNHFRCSCSTSHTFKSPTFNIAHFGLTFNITQLRTSPDTSDCKVDRKLDRQLDLYNSDNSSIVLLALSVRSLHSRLIQLFLVTLDTVSFVWCVRQVAKLVVVLTASFG